MTFGEKLKELRMQNGYTQKEVAEKIGVSVQTYLSYESGRRKPLRKPENYDKLAALLGCERDYLTNDDYDEDAPAPAPAAARKASGGRRGRGRAKKAATAPAGGEAPVKVELQYDEFSYSVDDLIRRAREAVGSAAGEIQLYVKPQENMAYYVAGDVSGSFPL